MKRMLIGLAALLLAGQAGAQGAAAVGAPLRSGPLSSGEVALHIVARGETTSRADRIELPVSITGHGASAALARAAAEAGVTRITAALVAAGIDRGAIVSQSPPDRQIGVNRMLDAMTSGDGGKTPSRSESVSITVTVADRAGLDRARQVLGTQADAQAETPKPTLRDDAPARRTAVAAALDHARHTADDYAAPLGLRVARVAAVSNAAGIADGVEELTEVFSQLQGRDKAPDSVTTRATAAVDFVLAPR